MYLQRLNHTHKFQVVVKITQIFVNLVVLYCIDNLIGKYLYNNRGGRSPPAPEAKSPPQAPENFRRLL